MKEEIIEALKDNSTEIIMRSRKRVIVITNSKGSLDDEINKIKKTIIEVLKK